MGKLYDINGAVYKLDVETSSATEESGVVELSATLPVNAVAYHSGWDSLVDAGFCERTLLGNINDNEAYPIYLYTIKKNKNWATGDYRVTTFDGTNELCERPKVLIIAGQHGNERATPSCALSFFETLMNDPAQADLLVTFDWFVIPLVNPWGYSNSLVSESGSVMWVDTAPSGFGADGIPVGYTLVSNADGYSAGIRRTSTGRDSNRDWTDTEYSCTDGFTYGFKTQEAQLLKTVLTANKFSLVVDLHQAPASGGSVTPTLCGFAGINTKPSAMESDAYNQTKEEISKKIAQAGTKTDVVMHEYTGLSEIKQTSYVWAGTSGNTFCNYAGGSGGNTENTDASAEHSVTVETSQCCYRYTNSNNRYNQVANTYGNTYTNILLRTLAELYK